MPHRLSRSSRLVWVLFLLFNTTPAYAHKVQIAEDVGGTLHIEPNDTPRAGEIVLAWFALTRQGGQTIPLAECNCQLSIYTTTSAAKSQPFLTPPLKAVSAERYQGIPGAEIRFPQPGAYQLQLKGTPTSGATFKPFELKFEVTVATGTTAPLSAPQPNLSANPPRQSRDLWKIPAIILSGVVGLGVLGFVWQRGRQGKSEK
ncbi:MAG TPA: hypothetical protein V6C95_24380 [Coleofasciculaceae cyanobacterium]